MVDLKKRAFTAGAAFIIVYFIYQAVSALFSPAIGAALAEFRAREASLAQAEAVLSQKERYGSALEIYRSAASGRNTGEGFLNHWVKDLLSYSSSAGLALTKLEPQAKRKSRGGAEEARLYLAFQGDMPALAGLLYHLRENDPLSSVESFSMKKDDAPGRFFCELVLSRSLK